MLIDEQSLKSREVVVHRRQVEVDILDEGSHESSFLLPPVEELSQGKPDLQSVKSALRERDYPDLLTERYRDELNFLLQKFERFKDSATYLSRIAGLAQLCGETERALSFSHAAAQIGKQPIFAYRYAESALKAQQGEIAYPIFEHLESQGYSDASLRLAELRADIGELESAALHVRKALEADVLDWRLQMIAGTLCLVKGEHQRAIRHYRVALSGKPNSSVIYANMAVSHFLLGHVRKALREAKKAVGLNPTNENALVFLADVTIQRKQNLESIVPYLERFLTYNPKSKAIVERLAKTYFQLGDYSKLIKALQRATQHNDDPALWNNIGVAYAQKRQLKIAITNFDKAIHAANVYSDRGAAIATLNFVTSLIELGRHAEAEKVCREYINGSPDRAFIEDDVLSRIVGRFIWVLFCQSKNEEGKQIAKEYVDNEYAHPALRVALCQILSTYYSLVHLNLDEAYKYARLGYEIVAKKGDFSEEKVNMVINNLAFVLIEEGRLDEAKPLVNALSTKVKQAIEFAYATKALYALRRGMIERGQAFYRVAVSFTQDPRQKKLFRQKLYLELGKYWVNRKDRKRAADYFRRAVKLKETGYPIKTSTVFNEALGLLSTVDARMS
jgi:tetratricopeptide (TPR) repeat protein